VRLRILLCLSLAAALGVASTVEGRAAFESWNNSGSQNAASPATCIVQHTVGNMVLGVTNWGTFGDYDNNKGPDCFTGEAIHACEFPKGSNTRYLYAGAFWIGAVKGRDTLVSTGADGWLGTHEMFPDVAPLGDIITRSITDPSKPEYQGAISEQDFIAVYFDTCTANCSGLANDPVDNRPHRPLGVQITQRSFAWSYAYAQDFVLFDYAIQNISTSRLKQVYMGIYVDADVYAEGNSGPGAQDDICGFKQSLKAWYSPSSDQCQYQDTINAAWIADNDGDLAGIPPALPVPNVTGTRIVRTPSDSLDVSFNWWISNSNSAQDFGPRHKSDTRDLTTGGNGTPQGDRNKYWFLRNGEFDYDQAYTAVIQPTDEIWKYPPQNYAAIWATGLDTRYLLSFGPFDIDPGQTLPISFAYVGGLNFHQRLDNLTANMPNNPNAFYDNLHFDNFGYNCTWASWIYDTPGFDTDNDNYRGKYHVCNTGMLVDSSHLPYDTTYLASDTIWYEGDGVPDFKGASPPPAPSSWTSGNPPVSSLRVLPTVGKIIVRWNGLRSETTRDDFSKLLDFEGYRVYYSRDDRSTSYSVLASYDVEDYNKYVYDQGTASYVLKETPYTLAQLKASYSHGDTTWSPLRYTRVSPLTVTGDAGDTVMYFTAQDYNRSIFGLTTDIVRSFPLQEKPVTTNKDSCAASDTTEQGFFKYYEYEYTINDLLPTVSYYINVTAFDFGSPSSGLPSLESPVTFNPAVTYGLFSADSVKAHDLKVTVYPNPYRIDGRYAESGFEGVTLAERAQAPDRNRRIHFYNLPSQCSIRIYTLDGDLVREISHNVAATDPLSTHETWDLITRNTQLAVSGLYYWTVQGSDGKVQIGKLVLIM
jgi:hypothetical protein